MIGKLITKLNWKLDIQMDEINKFIYEILNELSTTSLDNFRFNAEAQEVRRIMNFKNGYLKTFSLNAYLNYKRINTI